MLNFRSSRFIAFFICHELIVIAYYFQFVDHLEPCPLCIFQRLVFFVMSLMFLIAAIHNPSNKGKRYYNSITLIVSIVGMFISGRHVWLQHLPKDQVPTCGPGLNYLLDNFPLSDALNQILRGSGECADVSWTLFGFSMPELTLMLFITFAAWLTLALWNKELPNKLKI